MDRKKFYIYKLDINVLNIGSFILLVLFVVLGLLIYPSFLYEVFNNYSFLVFMVIYLLYMFVHELLHSIAYVIYGAKYKNITYGICLEKGVLCCLCKQNISKNNILHSLIYPLLFIGFITFIIGYIFKLPLLFILSILNISGCIGDIIMFFFIRKLDNNIEFSEFDDPTSFGIYSDKDISKEKHWGLNYVGTSSKLNRVDMRKIYISKVSIIFFVIILILGLIIKYM